MNDLSIIIVAGGKGVRMGNSLPKQYLMLHVKPILIWTIEHIYKALPKDLYTEVILVRPNTDHNYILELLDTYLTEDISLIYADGGKDRAESVRNGLSLAKGKYVAIHDGVRPFVTKYMFSSLWEKRESRAVIPAVLPCDSIRISDASGFYASFPRSEVRLVQTPQLFETHLLVDSYDRYIQNPDSMCTDDSSIVEKYSGIFPSVVEGVDINLKITTPKDLSIAEMYLKEGIFRV